MKTGGRGHSGYTIRNKDVIVIRRKEDTERELKEDDGCSGTD